MPVPYFACNCGVVARVLAYPMWLCCRLGEEWGISWVHWSKYSLVLLLHANFPPDIRKWHSKTCISGWDIILNLICVFILTHHGRGIHIDGLLQDCSISSALAMEILQSCTKPLIYRSVKWTIHCTDHGLSLVLCLESLSESILVYGWWNH